MRESFGKVVHENFRGAIRGCASDWSLGLHACYEDHSCAFASTQHLVSEELGDHGGRHDPDINHLLMLFQ